MQFAYLIMAHKNQRQLLLLLQLLDHIENDIFLHIDKKSSCFDFNIIKNHLHYAKIHIYNKFDIRWAGISQTKCQVFLLKEATQTFHDFYHLISGEDLPIKKHHDILAFFSKNKNKEFIHFESKDYTIKSNYTYYHFSNLNRRDYKTSNLLLSFEKRSIIWQKNMGINRKFYSGANWFSITHKLAIDFCENSDFMLKQVRWTISSDECILQTFVRVYSKSRYDFYKTPNSPDDYSGTARLIDWKRGGPYVWRQKDFNEIINSDRMFARKFDENIDCEIIKNVVKYVQ